MVVKAKSIVGGLTTPGGRDVFAVMREEGVDLDDIVDMYETQLLAAYSDKQEGNGWTDGEALRCLGKWKEVIEMDGVGIQTEFEVFNSGGAFEILLGKPWLTMAGAEQRFGDNSLKLEQLEDVLPNRYPLRERAEPVCVEPEIETKVGEVPKIEESADEDGEDMEIKDKQEGEEVREETESADEEGSEHRWKPVTCCTSSRLRNRSEVGASLKRRRNMYHVEAEQVELLEELIRMTEQGAAESKPSSAAQAREEARERAVRTKERRVKVEREFEERERERDVLATGTNHNAHLPTTPSKQRADPFGAAHVASILKAVTIGPNLSEEECTKARALVAKFADIFAHNLTVVLLVSTHSHKLNIPESTTFCKQVTQQPLTQAWKAWLFPTLNQMEVANIIKWVPNTYPVAVSPSNVVPKPGGTVELSPEYIQCLANKACMEARLQAPFPDVVAPPQAPPIKDTKLRLVHHFAEIGNVTKMSIKYMGFYIEGRRHYVYLCMPFGLTGAPTMWCKMLADAQYDLLADGMEIWMDNVGMGFNNMRTGLARTQRPYMQCRERSLLLLRTNTLLFIQKRSSQEQKS
ncbi:hypothetical protein FRC09_002498 [Ceratobasidium sp. 395]|nr:hypothetical protein FRC09_002498 [Ceratobasidium sp. 395]